MDDRSRKLRLTREDRPALAALAVLLKGVFFSREMLSNLGYDRASATRTLRKLSDAKVIERTPGGYVLGNRSFSELSKIATLGDLERIAEFAYDLYAMDGWDAKRLESVAVRFGEHLRAIRTGRASLAFLQLSKRGSTVEPLLSVCSRQAGRGGEPCIMFISANIRSHT